MTAYRLAEAGHERLPARARQAVSAELLPALAAGHEDAVLGSQRGPARDVQHVELRQHRRDLRERAGRRLADLRQRPAAQGRGLVRARGARQGLVEGRLRVLAGHARRPRPALRPRRADDERPEVPARPGPLRQDAEDARLPRRRAEARPGLAPRQPRRDVRQRRRPARWSASRSREDRPNIHGAHAPDLQAHRRVRPRLQPRLEELAGLHVHHGRLARRRRHPHAPRGARRSSRARAAATRWSTSSTTPSREGVKTDTSQARHATRSPATA